MRKVSQGWAVIRFWGAVAFLSKACQPGDATAGCRCCLLVSQSDLTKPGQRPLGHSSNTPPCPPPFSLKCLCYLAQSITCIKSNGWEDGGEGARAVRWVSGTGGQGQSLSPWQLLSKCSWQACMHPPTCTRGAAGTHIESRCLSHTLARTWTRARSRTAARTALSCWRSLGEHSNYANACQFINLVLDTTRFLDWLGMHISQG